MNGHREAVDALHQLGLSEYEAKCYVALTYIPQGTASEVSQVADIPRSRVYETMDRLQRKGLVETQPSKPKIFQSVDIDTTLRILRREYEAYFETVEDALRDIEPKYKEVERAVWAIENHEHVTERVLSLIDDTDEELILLLFDEDIVDDEVIARLGDATDRGTTVTVGTLIESVREDIREESSAVQFFTSDLIEWFTDFEAEKTIGRIVVSDRDEVLMSATFGERLPDIPEESATWSNGADHGFAEFMRELVVREVEHAADLE